MDELRAFTRNSSIFPILPSPDFWGGEVAGGNFGGGYLYKSLKVTSGYFRLIKSRMAHIYFSKFYRIYCEV